MVRADIITALFFSCCRALEMPEVPASKLRGNEWVPGRGKKKHLRRKDTGSTNQDREQVGHRSVGRSRKKMSSRTTARNRFIFFWHYYFFLRLPFPFGTQNERERRGVVPVVCAAVTL